MRKILLGNTGLSTTAIGYGCAGLMRPSTEPERQALLAAAFDVGIRHFDVARYYGHGQSEGFLGRFIASAGCRDEITVTTKFGMDPPAISGSFQGRLLMNIARKVASIHPSVRKILSARAGAGVTKNRFDVASAEASLNTSLRELRTDRIDLFLLHEATLKDSRTDGLLEFLENAKSAGKIRAFGLGSDFPLVPPIIANNPAVTQVIQIANCLGQWNRRLLPPDTGRLVNTHGALKVLPSLAAGLHSAKHEVIREWQALGSPSQEGLAGWLLALAMHDNPHGVTLFSSTQPSRIRKNVTEALRHSAKSSAEWHQFENTAEALIKADNKR